MSELYNEIVAAFLRRRGFTCDLALTDLGTGRKPDLWCQGPGDMWVEVKAPDDPLDEPVPLHIWDWLQKNIDASRGRWAVVAYVAETAHQKDAKVAVGLMRRLAGLAETSEATEIFIIVPDDPDYSQSIRFTATSDKGMVLFCCVRSHSGSYGYPYTFEPAPVTQSVQIWKGERSSPAVELASVAVDGRFRLALGLTAVETASFLTAIGREPSLALNTVGQIRECIKTASRQLKAGIALRPAPAVAFVVQRGITFDPHHALAAAFGDLIYRVALGSDRLEQAFGPNGRFTGGKHTSMSALVVCAEYGVPIIVHNPAATRPLARGLFGGWDFWPRPDGKLDRCKAAYIDTPEAALQIRSDRSGR